MKIRPLACLLLACMLWPSSSDYPGAPVGGVVGCDNTLPLGYNSPCHPYNNRFTYNGHGYTGRHHHRRRRLMAEVITTAVIIHHTALMQPAAAPHQGCVPASARHVHPLEYRYNEFI